MSAETPPPSARTADETLALGQKIFRTYFRAFATGQGNDWLQERTYAAAGSRYNTQHGKDALIAAWFAMSDRVQALDVPGNHPPQPDRKVTYQFKAHWQYFAGTLFHPRYQHDLNDWRCQSDLADIAHMLVDRDLYYMRETRQDAITGAYVPHPGRPVGDSGRDPRQSFVRDHVLEGATVKDPVLDAVFGDVRQVLVGTRPLEPRGYYYVGETYDGPFPKLAAQWEAHHPGEQFIDPALYVGTPLLRCLRPELG